MLFAFAFLLLPAGAGTVKAEAVDSDADVYAQIDAYLSRVSERAHIPALSAIVVDRDGTKFCNQYGEGATADTPFLLGSVSKSFTAACIMQLSEQGKLELDAPVSRYLPNAREGDRLTVRRLLTHTGGLGEHDNLQNYKIGSGQGRHVYANVNYALLGKIVEAVSGVPYETYVRERIFVPLNMTNAAATREQSEQNGLIAGYRNYFGFRVKSAPRYPESDGDWIAVPAGYLSASANDLGKYLQMYLRGGGEILSEESVRAMLNDGVRVEEEIPYTYAFGWTKIKEPLKETVYRHSGLVETGMSCIYLYPERGLGIAVLINTNDYFVTNDFMDRLDWSIPLMLMGEDPNEIGAGEYAAKHALYDLVYLAVFAGSVLPFLFLKRYFLPLTGKKFALRIAFAAALHLLLPVLLLLLSQIAFATPLWVARAFVPDFYLTAVASSVLLFAGGLAKAGIMLCARRSGKRWV